MNKESCSNLVFIRSANENGPCMWRSEEMGLVCWIWEREEMAFIKKKT